MLLLRLRLTALEEHELDLPGPAFIQFAQLAESAVQASLVAGGIIRDRQIAPTPDLVRPDPEAALIPFDGGLEVPFLVRLHSARGGPDGRPRSPDQRESRCNDQCGQARRYELPPAPPLETHPRVRSGAEPKTGKVREIANRHRSGDRQPDAHKEPDEEQENRLSIRSGAGDSPATVPRTTRSPGESPAGLRRARSPAPLPRLRLPAP